MKSLYWFMSCILICVMSFFTSCGVDDELSESRATPSYRVAIIMPARNQTEWSRTVNWAVDNICKALTGLPGAILLDIEWHDEAASDLEDYIGNIATDDRYVALVGPMSSVNARMAAETLKQSGKTLILPIATSTELQRNYAADGNVWNMVQSDMTQCEILLAQAKLSGHSSVSLLAPADEYGKSYNDWFAYQALELGLKVSDVIIYENEHQIREAVSKLAEYDNYYSTTLLFAPSAVEDFICFDDEFGKLKANTRELRFPTVLCTDIVNSSDIAARHLNRIYEGVSPSAHPASGFTTAYKEKFGAEPISGEAQLFDAVTMLAYALAAAESRNLNECLHSILSVSDGISRSWMPYDMAYTFSLLKSGAIPNLSGVTGDWDFDKRYGTTVLNTTYSHWILRDGKYTTLEYLSTDGTGRTTSTIQAWDSQASMFQQFDMDQRDEEYGELHDKWAVVISTSDTWANYRHQADALAMYQLLRRHGYDDSHIILILEDNIAYDSRNIYPGVVKVRPDGENLYDNIHVDYRLSDITISDFCHIMSGERLSHLSDVLDSGANDNVIVFWTGHGGNNRLYWGGNETVWGAKINELLTNLHNKRKYRKMMFVMDACYSGSIGEACRGIPGVVFLTAANAFEPSKADMKDPEMGVWLSNGFTRVFQETIDADPSISLRDLYYTVARHTVGSHATVYNLEHYGNAFTNSMEEYLGGCR